MTPPPAADTPVAAFDFDGTLTRRDTLFGFLRFACGDVALAAALARAVPTVLRARTGRLPSHIEPRDAGKEQMLRSLLRGRSAEWLAGQGEVYARRLPQRLRPDMVARLDWHRSAGHRLVIVSASLQTYLSHFGRQYGFEEVIGVRMAADDRGMLTGDLVGPNVRGPEKAVRLKAWLRAQGSTGPLWAYGNSSGDRELLDMADRPLMVGRGTVKATPDSLLRVAPHPEDPPRWA